MRRYPHAPINPAAACVRLLGVWVILHAAPVIWAQPTAGEIKKSLTSSQEKETEISSKGEKEGISFLASRITGTSEGYAAPAARLNAVRQLSARLSPRDSQALLSFIAGEQPAAFTSGLWHAIVNDVSDVLLRQQARVDGLDTFLITSARSQEDPVLRDYAIQKLGPLLNRHSADPMRKEAFEVLAAAAAVEGETLQGTALLSWKGALGQRISTDAAFRKAVLACLRSQKATPAAKLTALQMAAEAGLAEAAPAARAVLNDSQSSVAAKLSAIAALGHLGNPKEDSSLLISLSGDQAMATAAAAALEHLAAPR